MKSVGIEMGRKSSFFQKRRFYLLLPLKIIML